MAPPISPLSSEGSPRCYHKENYPPPAKKSIPAKQAWWKLCTQEKEMEKNSTQEESHSHEWDEQKGRHGRRLSVYNSTKEVQGPGCFYCVHGGLEYPSARKYCTEEKESDNESDIVEPSTNDKIPGQSVSDVIKQELKIDDEYSEPKSKCSVVDLKG